MLTLLSVSEAAMKRTLLLLAALLLLTACASPAAPAETAPAEPVATIRAQSPDTVVASAEVEPAQIVNLGFTISALVKEISINEGDLVEAGQPLIVLDTPDLEFAAISAEEDFNARALAAELQRQDKVKYVNPESGKVSWYPLPREVYLKALSIADQARAKWDTAEANLAQNTIYAPFDGTVIDVSVIPGELVQVNQVVITIANLNSLQITTTDLSERDIDRVKIGQNVDVYLEALDVTIAGKVTRIAPKSETIGGDVVFPVTITLDKIPDGLLWGMSAEIEIQTK